MIEDVEYLVVPVQLVRFGEGFVCKKKKKKMRTLDYVAFGIQAVIIVLVILYIYFTFRHGVVVPTARSNANEILPGLQQLTEKQTRIVFWFYSLRRRHYRKFTMDERLQWREERKRRPGARVRSLESGYYFNFALQRWERSSALAAPYVDATRNSIEQAVRLCYIADEDGEGEPVCEERQRQAFVKLGVGADRYLWNAAEGRLLLDRQSVFPRDAATCKFTVNRYKELLGLSYDHRDEADNEEQQLGVYFARDEAGVWRLRECGERPSAMFFDGEECRERGRARSRQGDWERADEQQHAKVREDVGRMNSAVYPDTKHEADVDRPLHAFYLHLDVVHVAYVDMNVESKIYPVTTAFYASCARSMFIVGTPKSDNLSAAEQLDGHNYTWRLEQLLDAKTRQELLEIEQNWCPALRSPLQVLYIPTGVFRTMPKPFIIHRNRVFYMHDYLLDVYKLVMDSEYEEMTQADEPSDQHVVANRGMLPYTRLYRLAASDGTTCRLYATFVGETILDMFAETRLLADYLPQDVQQYAFYGRDTYPVVVGDFEVDTWSCAAHDVAQVDEMFTYISLVDMFAGVSHYATTATRNLPRAHNSK